MNSASGILVTGASGFVGRALVTELARAGFAGMAVSRRPIEAVPERWEPIRRDELFEHARSLSIRTKTVVHLEVKQHVINPGPEDLHEFQRVNVRGTEQWLNWCDEACVERFVYFSSIKAIEPTGTGVTVEGDDETPGATPYGESKWQAEQRVCEWANAKPGRRALILRPAVVYGPGNQANIHAMLHGIATGRFCLVGPNANVKSLISLNNLVAGTRFLLERIQPGCEVFYLTDQQSYSVREVAQMMGIALGKRVPRIPLGFAKALAFAGDHLSRLTGRNFPLTTPRLHALAESTHFSCEKLMRQGFRHPQTSEEGIRELVECYLQERHR